MMHKQHLSPVDQLDSWRLLSEHAKEMTDRHLRDLFSEDAGRAARFTRYCEHIMIDFSKNHWNEKSLLLLLDYAKGCGIEVERERMFCGEPVNVTEKRPVFHTALRNLSAQTMEIDGQDVMPEVFEALSRCRDYAERFRSGRIIGAGGKALRHVVNLGIGGSDLGPRMAAFALSHYAHEDIRVSFVANVDGSEFAETVRHLDPESTLFIVASKTFTTQETMTNAQTARSWLQSRLPNAASLDAHFAAVTASPDRARAFGMDEGAIFPFWDWVGGRFSLSSAIALPLIIGIGGERFMEFLRGMHQMDQHFRKTPLTDNIPVLMALLTFWYSSFLGASTHAVLPYDHYLSLFPSFLQQGEMESNGKDVDRSGQRVNYMTAPITWGAPGTNGQHAFFQLLHQGTHLVPADFIGFIHSLNPIGDHHQKLMANFFAQTESLAFGRQNPDNGDFIQKFRQFSGNHPSTTILVERLTPYTLGQLVALYEHKIFVLGVLWNVYSFDQWGVELGKEMGNVILPELKESGSDDLSHHDASTAQLIRFYRLARAHRFSISDRNGSMQTHDDLSSKVEVVDGSTFSYDS